MNYDDKEEELIKTFKLAALNRISQMGMTPGELGAMIKKAAARIEEQQTKKVAWSVKDLNPIPLLKGSLGLGLLTLALTSGGGFGVGYVGEKVLGDREQDVTAARERQRIDTLRRATIRMNAESQVAREIDENDRKRKRRPQALRILSAV